MKVNFDLTDKVALVTGASRGIGESIAITLADYGAEVILVSRKIDALKEVEEKIIKRGGKAHCIAASIGKIDEIKLLFEQIDEKYGRLNILVNNAATNPYFGDVLNADETAWDKTIDVNLKGYFFMSQSAAKLMIKNGGGSIINVSSINGIRPAPMQGIYSITKAGVISMTKAFAKELAPFKVRVNALLPGLTDTKFSSVMVKNDDLMDKVLLPMIPLHRAAQPDEMAGAVLYLASEASSFTTGATIVVDGGALA
ncbi:MAG: short-chain dehydrogenase [Spirochaetae bacterium HGW-Spirochaetae-5]|nr:MAG: short-chain dehydrogenase [Spirochaetae bacterium HGW-Spirochaetae-5]